MECDIQIGDGSIYQDAAPPKPKDLLDSAAIDEWIKEQRYYLPATCSGSLHARVFWEDDQLIVRLSSISRQNQQADKALQPSVSLFFDIHEWEALAASVASKRRMMEMRNCATDADDTREE